MAKVDIPDLVEVIEIGFSGLHDFQKLWPMSGQTLRTRFKLLDKVLLTNRWTYAPSALEEPPGTSRLWRMANWYGDVVDGFQRRSWTYIQEVASIQYFRLIEASSLQFVMSLARLFPVILERAKQFHIPCRSWPLLFKTP